MVRYLSTIIFILMLTLLMTACDDSSDLGTPEITGSSFITVAGFSTISFFDTYEMGNNLGSFGLGNAPNWIITRNNDLYVINSYSNDLSSFFYSDSTIHFNSSFDLGLQYNRNPYSADFLNDNTLLITNLLENSVSVYDLDINSVIETWSASRAPEGILFYNGYVYVINTGFDFNNLEYNYGSLYQLDPENGSLIDSVQLGVNPQFLTNDNSGNLHITCTGNYEDINGEIWILDAEDLSVITTTTTQYFPGRIVKSDWNRMYIAAGGWLSDGQTNGIVLTYSIISPGDIQAIETGIGVIDVTVDNSRESVFVACMDNRSVDEIRSDTLYASYPVQDSPLAISIWEVNNE